MATVSIFRRNNPAIFLSDYNEGCYQIDFFLRTIYKMRYRYKAFDFSIILIVQLNIFICHVFIMNQRWSYLPWNIYNNWISRKDWTTLGKCWITIFCWASNIHKLKISSKASLTRVSMLFRNRNPNTIRHVLNHKDCPATDGIKYGDLSKTAKVKLSGMVTWENYHREY